ncbi:MAG: zinc ABC transporter substrate-binding protein [Methanobacterium sp.]
MNRKRVIIVLVILIFAFAALYYLASKKTDNMGNNDKIGVVVSLGPQVEFVKAVGGDKVDVTLMVPSNADPHTYEPLANQLSRVSNAKMYAELGTPIEFEVNYMDKIRAINPDMLVLNTSKGIKLIPNSAENESTTMDPHDYVDPKNAKIMVNNIYQGLVQIDPADKDYYQKNRDSYLHQLDDLDKNTTKLLQGKQGTYILIYHPAFGYYAKDYNLTQVGAMINDEEPSPQRIAMMVNIAKQNNITVIYTEPQYDPKFIQSIASQIGAQVLNVNDLDEHYIKNMKDIATEFSKA